MTETKSAIVPNEQLDEILPKMFQADIDQVDLNRLPADGEVPAGNETSEALVTGDAQTEPELALRRETASVSTASILTASELGMAMGGLQSIEAVFVMNYDKLVRLANMFLKEPERSREIVMDAFVAMMQNQNKLRDPEKQVAYLKKIVVNRVKSELRHRTVIDRNAPLPMPDTPSAEHGAIVLVERALVVRGLLQLPERQREALVLRYYGDLSEEEIATAMGVTRGTVKTHNSKGIEGLRTFLINMGFEASNRSASKRASATEATAVA